MAKKSYRVGNVRFTERQYEVMELLIAGKTVDVIGQRLSITQATAEEHKKRVYAAIQGLGHQVHNRSELILWYQNTINSRPQRMSVEELIYLPTPELLDVTDKYLIEIQSERNFGKYGDVIATLQDMTDALESKIVGEKRRNKWSTVLRSKAIDTYLFFLDSKPPLVPKREDIPGVIKPTRDRLTQLCEEINDPLRKNEGTGWYIDGYYSALKYKDTTHLVEELFSTDEITNPNLFVATKGGLISYAKLGDAGSFEGLQTRVIKAIEKGVFSNPSDLIAIFLALATGENFLQITTRSSKYSPERWLEKAEAAFDMDTNKTRKILRKIQLTVTRFCIMADQAKSGQQVTIDMMNFARYLVRELNRQLREAPLAVYIDRVNKRAIEMGIQERIEISNV